LQIRVFANCTIPGYYAASSGKFLNVSGQPLGHIFRGSRILDPQKMGPIGCPETSVRNYHYSLRNNPEERSSHLLRDGSLKTRKFCTDVWFPPKTMNVK